MIIIEPLISSITSMPLINLIPSKNKSIKTGSKLVKNKYKNEFNMNLFLSTKYITINVDRYIEINKNRLKSNTKKIFNKLIKDNKKYTQILNFLTINNWIINKLTILQTTNEIMLKSTYTFMQSPM